MHEGTEKNEVFGDYAAFLHALLPQAHGFLFHDRHARLFWHDNAPDTSQLNDAFHQTLNQILRVGDLPGDTARVPLTNCVAYLVRLVSDTGRTLGVLTALIDPELANMPHKFCSDLLSPARRSMERELSLRVHLLDANRKLTDHSCVHDFLREISELSRSAVSCTDTLQSMLELCLKQLQLDGAVLYSPDHELNLRVGPHPAGKMEVELLYDSLHDLVVESPQTAGVALASRPAPDPHERSRCWPILDDGKHLAGVVVLSRPADAASMDKDTANIAGFLTSTIEHLLEKSFDPLTGLMAWPGFEVAMEQACSHTSDACSVLYLDLDQLHMLNDTLGHEHGDIALRKLGRIMRKVLPGMPVTRVTSDSFAALLPETSLDQANKLGEKICQHVRAMEIMAADQCVRPSVSIGVAPLSAGTGGASSRLVPAQVACQAAKDRGRGRVEVYESGDQSIIRRMDDLSQVGSIRSAIEGGRLVLFAQPIVRMQGVQTLAYHELLVRMLNTAGEPIPPSEFMGAAERYQLMQDLDRWVVNKAIETLTEQHCDKRGLPLRFAVNLSGQSIGSDDFLAYIKFELARTGLDPTRLCFELTETVAVGNLVKAQTFIQELRELGCTFSLDDFGTGLSSFAYLKMFKVDKLKIDGSFVKDICENEVSRSMIAAITDIARVMNIETVAEYVQSDAILDIVSQLGVDWAQGYHMGEPVRLRELFGSATIIDKAGLADVEPFLLEQLPA